MPPFWDDRHPFVTAETFRTSMCTGQKISSLGGISTALADLDVRDIHENRESDCSSNIAEKISAKRSDQIEILWDDRRPFFTARVFGLGKPSNLRIAT